LLAGLRSVFETRKISPSDFCDKDTFLAWVANAAVDLEVKAQVMAQAYYAALNIQMSIPNAISLIRRGSLLI